MLVLASNDISAFTVIGGVFAVFAVVVAGLGVMRHGFPSAGGEKIVIALAALLMLGTVGSAIATSGEEEPEGAEHGETAPNEASPEAAPPPESAPEGAPESGQGAAAQTLQISTDPGGELAFDKTELAGQAGTVKIVADNPSPVPHNVAIEGQGVDEEGPVVQKGGTSEVEGDLKPGSYTFYCSVPGHREAGMEGTLTVK